MSHGRVTLPGLVLLAGVSYSLFLQTLFSAQVVNLSDAGLKVLMTQQFSRGDLHPDLRLAAEPWVRDLWDRGLYPFKPPNVYQIEGRRFIRYSLLFPLVSAPFYRLLGFRGLYVVPLVATWVLWFAFARALRTLRLRPFARAAALACLVFASFVTYYSATFWEHTAAVALSFLGTALVFARPLGRPPKAVVALQGGLLVGLSTWVREELLCLVAAYGVLACLLATPRSPLRRWPRRTALVWTLGLAAPPAAMFAFNAFLFGSPLGVHGLNVADELTRSSGISGARSLLYYLSSFLSFFPLAPLAGLAVWPWPHPDRRRATVLAVLATVFIFTVPWLVRVQGKEWGPRFLVAAVPLLCLVLGIAFEGLRRQHHPWVRRGAALVGLALFALGAFRNTVEGSLDLKTRYARRLVAVRFVQADDRRFVAVSSEFTAELLAPACSATTFFLVEGKAEIGKLARALAERGQRRFLYLADPVTRTPLLGGGRRQLSVPAGRGLTVQLEEHGRLDRYLAYDGVIVGRSSPRALVR